MSGSSVWFLKKLILISQPHKFIERMRFLVYFTMLSQLHGLGCIMSDKRPIAIVYEESCCVPYFDPRIQIFHGQTEKHHGTPIVNRPIFVIGNPEFEVRLLLTRQRFLGMDWTGGIEPNRRSKCHTEHFDMSTGTAILRVACYRISVAVITMSPRVFVTAVTWADIQNTRSTNNDYYSNFIIPVIYVWVPSSE